MHILRCCFTGEQTRRLAACDLVAQSPCSKPCCALAADASGRGGLECIVAAVDSETDADGVGREDKAPSIGERTFTVNTAPSDAPCQPDPRWSDYGSRPELEALLVPGYVSFSKQPLQAEDSNLDSFNSLGVHSSCTSVMLASGRQPQRQDLPRTTTLSQLLNSVSLASWVGQGAQGAVVKAQWRSGAPVAVKWLVTDGVNVPAAYMEALLAKILAHPFLVQTFHCAMCQLDESVSQVLGSAMKPIGKPATCPTSRADGTVTQNREEPLDLTTAFDSFEGAHPAPGSWPVDCTDVLKQLGAASGKYVVQIVSEWCDEGTLHAAIRKGVFRPHGSRTRTWALRALLRTAQEVALGMCQLHSLNIIHGDLKPGNVLLKSSRVDTRGFVAKVADFGLSRLCRQHENFVTTAEWGTVPYMAGEYLDNKLCKSSDVYSFGVLLWQMYTGKAPFAGHHEAHVAVGVMMGSLQLDWPSNMPPPLLRLGKSCCRHEPDQRPTFKECVVALAGIEVQVREVAARCRARYAATEAAMRRSPTAGPQGPSLPDVGPAPSPLQGPGLGQSHSPFSTLPVHYGTPSEITRLDGGVTSGGGAGTPGSCGGTGDGWGHAGTTLAVPNADRMLQGVFPCSDGDLGLYCRFGLLSDIDVTGMTRFGTTGSTYEAVFQSAALPDGPIPGMLTSLTTAAAAAAAARLRDGGGRAAVSAGRGEDPCGAAVAAPAVASAGTAFGTASPAAVPPACMTPLCTPQPFAYVCPPGTSAHESAFFCSGMAASCCPPGPPVWLRPIGALQQVATVGLATGAAAPAAGAVAASAAAADAAHRSVSLPSMTAAVHIADGRTPSPHNLAAAASTLTSSCCRLDMGPLPVMGPPTSASSASTSAAPPAHAFSIGTSAGPARAVSCLPSGSQAAATVYSPVECSPAAAVLAGYTPAAKVSAFRRSSSMEHPAAPYSPPIVPEHLWSVDGPRSPHHASESGAFAGRSGGGGGGLIIRRASNGTAGSLGPCSPSFGVGSCVATYQGSVQGYALHGGPQRVAPPAGIPGTAVAAALARGQDRVAASAYCSGPPGASAYVMTHCEVFPRGPASQQLPLTSPSLGGGAWGGGEPGFGYRYGPMGSPGRGVTSRAHMNGRTAQGGLQGGAGHTGGSTGALFRVCSSRRGSAGPPLQHVPEDDGDASCGISCIGGEGEGSVGGGGRRVGSSPLEATPLGASFGRSRGGLSAARGGGILEEETS